MDTLMRSLRDDFVLLIYSDRDALARRIGRMGRGSLVSSREQNIPGGIDALDPRPKGDAKTPEDAALFRAWWHLGSAMDHLEAMRACAQDRDLMALRYFRLLELAYPSTHDEWRARRRKLESRLTDAGFSPRQMGDILRDGPGDRRRRASMRRRRRTAPRDAEVVGKDDW